MKKVLFLILFFIPSSVLSQTWTTVGGGTDSSGNGVRQLYVFNNQLWVVGEFTSVAGNTIPSFGKASWDSTSWISENTSLGWGFPYCISEFNGNLYFAGSFRNVNNNPYCRKIAGWNGTNWFPLGKGIDGNISQVNAIQHYNGDLYVGGQFILVDSTIAARRIARWDGSQWYAMGTGFTGGLTNVYSMAVYNNELYVGGEFSSIDGLSANNICKWNGTAWDSLGSGINGFVRCLIVDTITNILYVGGLFSEAGGIPALTGVAAWNGINWSAVGTAPFLSPVTMCMYQNKLFAGGAQYNIVNNLGDTINELAWFNGTEWMPACNTIDLGEVETMAVYKNELYVGGYFQTINNLLVRTIARTYSPTLETSDIKKKENEISIQPNPASNKIEVKINSSLIKPTHWQITDAVGKKVFSDKINLNANHFDISTKSIPEGIYFFTAFKHHNIITKEKIIIMR